jgi:hypothetical protein
MKLFSFALFTFLTLAAPSILLAQQSASFENLGALNNSIAITGQIAGGERHHAYKFSIAERTCVRIARKDTSVSLRAYLYDARGGLLQKERLDSARNKSKFIQQTLFPADYVLEVELFYGNDTAAVYDLVIARC